MPSSIVGKHGTFYSYSLYVTKHNTIVYIVSGYPTLESRLFKTRWYLTPTMKSLLFTTRWYLTPTMESLLFKTRWYLTFLEVYITSKDHFKRKTKKVFEKYTGNAL